MTAGSGRRLYESYGKHRPLGAFLKILLESETWNSTEFYLEWRLKATKSRCLVFQLAPSMPRTGANATGLSEGTWRTPRATDQAGPASTRCRNFTEGIKSEFQLREQVKAIWPTPDASKAGKTSRSGDRKGEPLIGGIVRSVWATPNASDGSGGGQHPDKRVGHSQQIADQASGNASYGCLAQTEKFVVRLGILSAWLMGYPWSYLKNWERKGDKRRKTAKSTEAS